MQTGLAADATIFADDVQTIQSRLSPAKTISHLHNRTTPSKSATVRAGGDSTSRIGGVVPQHHERQIEQ